MDPKNKIAINFKVWFVLVLAIIGLTSLLFLILPFVTKPTPPNGGTTIPPVQDLKIEDIEKFSSEQEFVAYLTEAMILAEDHYGLGMISREAIALEAPSMSFDKWSPTAPPAYGEAPDRYSETNVQVAGIDEPDIVKTDGINIYFSSDTPYYWRGFDPSPMPEPLMFEEDMIDFSEYIPKRPRAEDKTKIIKAFPWKELGKLSDIEKTGKLLLKNNILVIFEQDKITAFDVANPKKPNQKWEIKLDKKTQLTGTRLYENTIYLITANYIQSHRPCIIEPMIINGNSLKIDCTSIYHPKPIIPVDTTYTVAAINLENGELKNKISFVGSASNSIIYVSLENIYVSYFQSKPMHEFMISFLKDECRDIVPGYVIERLERLLGYDISSRAKMVEFETILEDWFNSLGPDDELMIENELTNRMPEYYKKNMRSLESTGIIKIGVSDLQIKAAGSIPGILLNQFALDEYNGNLRVATTIGERSWFFGMSFGGGRLSANDIYVLDENLKQIGSVRDLGLEERIYSARFIGDKGYLVTFREIDPFYVLDLSDPKNPQMKGELKIPGYSSYLHPVSKDKILGVGREGSNVKISLFDVSNPSDPKETDKYFLNEYWSEILDNHHAFLLDNKHEIFFLPGSKGAYIFSYSKDKIKLIKATKETQVKRALYIDDYLYIISVPRIIVLDQKTWETVSELNL